MAKRRKMVDTSVPESEDLVEASRGDQRTARRGVQARLEKVAQRLTRADARVWAKLDLEDAVRREVGTLATLSAGSALPRQRRRVAGLLRGYDLDELERRVEEAFGALQPSQASTYRLERLRRELLDPEDDALTRIFEQHPGIDRPRLHQAVRAARREAEAGAPGRRFKELFQVLKELGLARSEPAPAVGPADEPTEGSVE